VIEFEGGAAEPPAPLEDPVGQMPGSPDLVGGLADHAELEADGFRFLATTEDRSDATVWDEYLLT